MENQFPQGKFMTTVKLGPKGQIVIPKEAREMFGLKAGDNLLLLADTAQGIALQPFSYAEAVWNAVNRVRKEEE